MDYIELPEIKKELDYIYESREFVLGEYIYMAMGEVLDHTVCIAVAYKIDYCLKKALQFIELDSHITFTHINKVKVGELERCCKFSLS